MSETAAAHPMRDRERFGILIVDDEDAILESLAFTLESDYRVFTASNGRDGLAIFDAEDIALVIADQNMPEMTGVEFLEHVIDRDVRAIRMMLTGYADISSLERAINSGRIYRYITKPWEPDELRINIKRALESYVLSSENSELAGALAQANERLRAENTYLRHEVERRYSFDGIVGNSSAMQRVFELMKKVSETDTTVLISGETGTGKELVARAIHYAGHRQNDRFVAQNCGALPDTLLESELFGHVRGAFTGAYRDKKGLFESAHRGSVFLDEIGDTEPGMQVRLLRVLQDGEIRPIGSSDTRKVDVRVIAATNRDLETEVQEGRFREDLFYRLRVVEIEVPPLRERPTDVPVLAHHFLEAANERMRRKLEGFSNAAMDALTSNSWRGNVRELENEIERLVALASDEEQVSLEMLSEHVRTSQDDRVDWDPGDESIKDWDLNRSVDNMKRRMIVSAIQKTGSKTRAAAQLGIPRQSLQKMMKRLGLTDAIVNSA